MEVLKELYKVELHVHLEGAIPLPALWKLIKKYNYESKVGEFSKLEEKFQYKNIAQFFKIWNWKNKFLREYEDFEFIASEVAKDLAAQNICYAEMFYAPGSFEKYGLEPQMLTEVIRKGFNNHSDKIMINLVPDLIRDYGSELGMEMLHKIADLKELGVIGIGIGGTEHLYPPEIFREVYEEARNLGFKTSAHAGEFAGPQSVWDAINSTKVDRIGHGTRAIEDPKLVAFIKKEQIPIEMCPISNLRTKVVKSIKAHPIKEFYRKGLLVSVNTDDPKMFNTSLNDEYNILIDNLGFTLKDINVLIYNAVQSAWCDENTKKRLLDKIMRNDDIIT